MISIIKDNERLVLEYTSDFHDASWVDAKLKKERKVIIGRIFTFTTNDVLTQNAKEEIEEGEISRRFILGTLDLDGDYYKISKNILKLKYDLLISKNYKLTNKSFIAHRNISIFSKINDLIDEPIIIGGSLEDAIPEAEFDYLLGEFPTSTELTHYSGARISRVLSEYLGTMSDAQKKLDTYLKVRNNKNRSSDKSIATISSETRILIPYELEKFKCIYSELEKMLAKWDDYRENHWRDIIAGFLCIIFPKYIAVLKELKVKDFYSKAPSVTERSIDLALVDVNGSIDIVELKRPFEKCLLSQNPYRNNYTPKKELTGAIMQAEKYIFHLSKWGIEGEKEILKKRQRELPPNFQIKVTSPKALIILGRDANFAPDQQFDFEIIRRKYANMIDIVTYDDLLRRLENIIIMLSRKKESLSNLVYEKGSRDDPA